MRIPAALLLLALFVSLGSSALPQEVQKPVAGRQVTPDLAHLLAKHKQAQGGAERYDGIRTISFDYTPSRFDEEGKQVFAATRKVALTLRVNSADQELRTVRIESSREVPGTEAPRTAQLVSLVSEDGSARVWEQAEGGEYELSEDPQLKRFAHFDSKALLAQMDLLMVVDSAELQRQFSGAMTRDSKVYDTVEVAFRPGRAIAEPTRLYFSTETALIERMDVFHPESHLRVSTTRVEGYQDYEGFKFPGALRTYSRGGAPTSAWRMENVKLNPKLPSSHFLRP